jgi:hypothetical protein
VAADAAATPLPADQHASGSQGPPVQDTDTHDRSLPTREDTEPFPSIERPTTPPSLEDSRALLKRLTGLEPWQLEAFPDETPPLPVSRPPSPGLQTPEQSSSTTPLAQRRLSSTSVPIRFRRPLSGSPGKDLTLDLKQAVSPVSSPLRPPGPRHAASSSGEFKTSREFRPLYLVERNRKSMEIEEVLPELPSSGSPSQASSTTGTEDDYQSALESPHLSTSDAFEDSFMDPMDPFSLVSPPQPGPELQHPELAEREIEEVDESGQSTPKASKFPSGILTPAGPSSEDLTRKLEDVQNVEGRASPLGASAPIDDSKMLTRSRDPSPSKSSSLLQNAALGALVGTATAAALRHRSPSPSSTQRPASRAGSDFDFMGGDLDEATIAEAAAFAPPPKSPEQEKSTLSPRTPPASTAKKGKKARKGSKGKSLDLGASSGEVQEMSAVEMQRIREMDTAAAVEDWFAAPAVESPKKVEEKKPELVRVESEPDPNLLRRDSYKAKAGKKKGKGKAGKKGSISETPVESPAATPTEAFPFPEQAETGASSSYKNFVPTFVENEDDWVKNRAESAVTDDATLVGEPGLAASESLSKEARRQKVLDTTAPHGHEDMELRRAEVETAASPNESEALAKKLQGLETPVEEKTRDAGVGDEDAPVSSTDKAELATEEDFSPISKGKKGKKAKKGKRGSQIVDPEPENIVPAPEDRQEQVEKDVPGPALEQAEGVPIASSDNQPSAAETIAEADFEPISKGKKGKKDKKGKRGSQIVEAVPAALPSEPESQQQQIEREILAPVFDAGPVSQFLDTSESPVSTPAEPSEPAVTLPSETVPKPKEEGKVDVMDFLVKSSDPPTPAEPVSKDVAAPTEATTTPPRDVVPEVQPAPEQAAGWGGKLWGALGWGKKNKPSTPEPQESIVKPVVEQKAEAFPFPTKDDTEKTDSTPAIPEDSTLDVKPKTEPEFTAMPIEADKAEVAVVTTADAAEPKEIPAEDDWAVPKVDKKGKKGKKSKRGSLLTEPEPDPEVSPAAAEEVVEPEPARDVTLQDTIVEPTPTDQDEWALPSSAKKKDKKGKKSKRGSLQTDEVAEPEPETSATIEKPSEQTTEDLTRESIVDEEPTTTTLEPDKAPAEPTPVTEPEQLPSEPQPVEEDEWASLGKKKGKKGKKGKRESAQLSSPVTTRPSTPTAEVLQDLPADNAVESSRDLASSSEVVQPEAEPVIPAPVDVPEASATAQLDRLAEPTKVDDLSAEIESRDVPVREEAVDDWAAPLSKKDRKKKGKSFDFDVEPSTADDVKVLEEPTPALEVDSEPTQVNDQPPVAENVEVEQAALPVEQQPEDDWAAPLFKKDKKKKGKKGRSVDFDIGPSTADDVQAVEKPAPSLGAAPEPSDTIIEEPVQPTTPTEQDEWALPSFSKRDGKKKGKKGKSVDFDVELGTPEVVESTIQEREMLPTAGVVEPGKEEVPAPAEVVETGIEEVLLPAVDDEWAMPPASSKKGKKKGKKGKSVDFDVEPETPELPEPTTQEREAVETSTDAALEPAVEDEWAMPSLAKKDKKKKGKKGKSLDLEAEPSTPTVEESSDKQEDNATSGAPEQAADGGIVLDDGARDVAEPNVLQPDITAPSAEQAGVDATVNEPLEPSTSKPIAQDIADETTASKPEEPVEDEYAMPSKKDKKKKGKKGKAGSGTVTPSVQEEEPATRELAAEDVPSTSSEPTVVQPSEVVSTEPEVAPPLAEDQAADDWAAPVSKKDKKKGKKGKKSLFEDEPAPTEVPEPGQSTLDASLGDATEAMSAAPPSTEVVEDEWAAPLSKKDKKKKGKKSGTVTPIPEPAFTPIEEAPISDVQQVADFPAEAESRDITATEPAVETVLTSQAEYIPEVPVSTADLPPTEVQSEPTPAEAEQKQAEEDEWAAPVSKKDKKKGKKSKRLSALDSEPATPVEEAKEVPFDQPAPAPEASVVNLEQQIEADAALPAPIVQEKAQDDEWASIGKKDKKKGKKSKRLPALDSEPSTPLETPVEEVKEVPFDEPAPAPEVPEANTDTVLPEPVAEQPAQDDEWAPISKKDKKKGKKGKRVSLLESEPSTSADTPAEEPKEMPLDKPATVAEASQAAEDVTFAPPPTGDLKDEQLASEPSAPKFLPIAEPKSVTTEEIASVPEASITAGGEPPSAPPASEDIIEEQPADEWAPISKKDKKKGKKGKRSSILESEPSTPVATLAEELTAPSLDEPSQPTPQETSIDKEEEPVEDEWAPISKKDKKKGKKAKRASTLESENLAESPITAEASAAGQQPDSEFEKQQSAAEALVGTSKELPADASQPDTEPKIETCALESTQASEPPAAETLDKQSEVTNAATEIQPEESSTTATLPKNLPTSSETQDTNDDFGFTSTKKGNKGKKGKNREFVLDAPTPEINVQSKDVTETQPEPETAPEAPIPSSADIAIEDTTKTSPAIQDEAEPSGVPTPQPEGAAADDWGFTSSGKKKKGKKGKRASTFEEPIPETSVPEATRSELTAAPLVEQDLPAQTDAPTIESDTAEATRDAVLIDESIPKAVDEAAASTSVEPEKEEEAAVDEWAPISKKDKKKGKKDKKKSGTVTPVVEAVLEPRVEDAVATPVPETLDEPISKGLDESITFTAVEPEQQVEATDEWAMLSKKDNKKAKKAKRQSGTVTPVVEAVPEAQIEERVAAPVPENVDEGIAIEAPTENMSWDVPPTEPFEPAVPQTAEPEPTQPAEEDDWASFSKKDKKKGKKNKKQSIDVQQDPAVVDDVSETQPTEASLTTPTQDVTSTSDIPTTLPDPTIPTEPEQPAEEDEWAPISKKDKKKGKKGKGKLSGAATPIFEDVPQVKAGSEFDVVPAEDQGIDDVKEIGEAPEVAVERVQDKAVEDRGVEDVKPVQDVQLSAEKAVEAKPEPEVDEWAPISKKDKKKGKKGKKSGAATPLAEDVVEEVPPSGAAKDEALPEQDRGLDLSEPVTLEPTESTAAEPSELPTAEPIEPSVDEWALPSKKKKGKKGKKSGTVTPVSEPVIEAPVENVPETAISPVESTSADHPQPISEYVVEPLVESVPVAERINEESREIDEPFVDAPSEPAVLPETVDVKAMEDAPAVEPVAEAEDEWAAPTSSKKKGKKDKKAKRQSGTSTPAIEEPLPASTDEPVLNIPAEPAILPDTVVEKTLDAAPIVEPVAEAEDDWALPTSTKKKGKKDKKAKRQSGTSTPAVEEVLAITTENAPLPELESEQKALEDAPLIEQVSEPKSLEVAPIVEPVAEAEDEWASMASSLKKKGKKDKKAKRHSSASTPAIEQALPALVDDAPVLEPESAHKPEEEVVQLAATETFQAAEATVPDDFEQPTLGRKLSKKDKKGKKKAVAFGWDDEPSVESKTEEAVVAETALVAETQDLTALPSLDNEATRDVQSFEETQQLSEHDIPTTTEVANSEAVPASDPKAQDPIVVAEAPVEPNTAEAATAVVEDEWASLAPKKGKKGKKDKKSKRQSTSDWTEETQPQASDVVEASMGVSEPTSEQPLAEPSTSPAAQAISAAEQPSDMSLDVADAPTTENVQLDESSTAPILPAAATSINPEASSEVPASQAEPEVEEWASISRKASKKGKKGKKAQEAVLTPAEVVDEPATPLEPEAQVTAMPSEPTTLETTKDEPEDEWAVPAKKSKKEKKKGKKSLSTSGTVTPALEEVDVPAEPTVADIAATSPKDDIVRNEQLPITDEIPVQPSATEPETTSSNVVADVPDTQDSVPLADMPTTTATKEGDGVQDISEQFAEPANDTLKEAFDSSILSPDSKALLDEAASFRQRSEALERNLAASEDPEPATAPATSMFDIVSKLSKKDKKKGKKGKASTFDLSEPTTPIAEPEAPVETQDTPAELVKEEDTAFEVPSRKSNKKDKKKGKAAAFSWDEPTEPVVEPTVLPESQEGVSLSPTPLETATEQAEVEPLPPSTVESRDVVEEAPALARKLSKKDKKKAKQTSPAWDEPSADIAEPTLVPESQDIVTEGAQFDAPPPTPSSEETLPEASSAAQDTPTEDTSLLSRKPSKKDKKKAKQAAFAWEEPSPEVAEPTGVPEAGELQPDSSEPTPVVYQKEVATITEEAPVLSRKLSKKDKKKAKQTAFAWEEPEDAPREEAAAHVSDEPALEPGQSQTDVREVVEPSSALEQEPVQPSDTTLTNVEASAEHVEPAVSTPMEDEAAFTPTLTRKQSKKDKKKGKAAAFDFSEPSPAVEEQAVSSELITTDEPAITAKDDFAAPVSKKDKKKGKKKAAAFAWDEPESVGDTQVLQESTAIETLLTEESAAVREATDMPTETLPIVEEIGERGLPVVDEFKPTTSEYPLEAEPTLAEVPTSQPEPQAEDDWAMPIKKGKKDKRKSKGMAAFEEPVEVEQPIEPTSAVEARAIDADNAAAVIAPETTSAPVLEEPFTPGKPNKKKGKKHKLAAMFEPDSPEVVTPVELKESRPATPLETQPRAKSPEQDFDFAATIAAGLKESGFDSDLVLNDPTFHRSTSPPGAPNISADDDVAAAKEGASKSKYGTMGRSPSPPSRELDVEKAAESQVVDPIIATASEQTTTFDPMDVLNDPAFSQRKSPSGVLEEPDRDELWSSSKGKKAKGKKKRVSVPDTPVESDKRTTDLSGLVMSETGMDVIEPTTSRELPVEPIGTPQATSVEEPEDIWAAPSTKKGKKGKKDKKRASLTPAIDEAPAVEAPLIEAPSTVPLDVGPPAEPTAREFELDKPSTFTTETEPVFSAQREVSIHEHPIEEPSFGNVDLQHDQLQKAAPATDDIWDEPIKKGKKSKGKSKRASIVEQAVESTAPSGTVTPFEEDYEMQPVIAKDAFVPEEPVEEDWSSSKKKKGKKGKKEKAGETAVVVAGAGAALLGAIALAKEEEKKRESETADMAEFPPTFDQQTRSVEEADEYPFPIVSTPNEEKLPEETGIAAKEAEVVDEWALSMKKKGKKGKKNQRALESVDLDEQQEPRNVVDDRAIHVSQAGVPEPHVDAGRAWDETHAGAFVPEHEGHKRREHPVSPEAPPEEKRVHLDASAEPATRGHSPIIEPTWSFGGIRDSAVHVADSPVLPSAPQFATTTQTRDSGYHDAGYSPTLPQGPTEIVEESRDKKKRRSKDPATPRHGADRSITEHYEERHQSESSPLPELHSFTGVKSPNAIDSSTKERSSHLFNSSPSSRQYGESPIATSKSHTHDVAPLAAATIAAAAVGTVAAKHSRDEDDVPRHGRKHEKHASPAKATKQEEPYRSIFGDPSEKKQEKSAMLSTPTSKHIRTSSQLDSIKESSPDETLVHKKGRQISDVGTPDHGVKSARRSTTSATKPLSERLQSPPPVTPTPASRRSAAASFDPQTPSNDSPWHQVHESVDRSMALSPARRLPHDQRSSPLTDPTKQHFGEQRSPSAFSDRSMRLRSPNEDRPLSAASNRSLTPSLRRVDRSRSGDLRSQSSLGEVNAAAKGATPKLAGLALAAGATAAIAGIASSSKYDPVKDKGKGRADMPDVYVSLRII